MKAKTMIAVCMLIVGGLVWGEQLSGVGLKLVSEPGKAMPLVKAVAPAQQAGIKAGVYLVSVNGTNVVGKPLREVATLLRGIPRTKVTLETFDPAAGTTNKITLKRIPIETAD